ncbi:hypothetical protein [Marinoscillum sp. MHG1-6]|uniref:hypothetical protein n=1 Tax=Marinoscillum sp. MHG1-6 TaxID=2959627 RepID=UPI0021588A41|nr:hypothetical protein [Marinoscillum sp. MHG1-6]
MKRLFSIVLLHILMVSSLSLTMQYLYQEYLCEDTQEYLEVAGRKITICGKVCSMDDLENQEQNAPQPKHQYNTEIPPLFLSVSDTQEHAFTSADILHESGLFCFYQHHLVNELIEPPSFI